MRPVKSLSVITGLLTYRCGVEPRKDIFDVHGAKQPGSSTRKMKFCYTKFHHESATWSTEGGFYVTTGSQIVMFFVYVLISKKDNKFYIGLTESVDDRVKAHNSGKVESTKHRRPLDLIYYEAYLDKYDAEGRELFLKSGSGHKYLNKQLKHFFENTMRPVKSLSVITGLLTYRCGVEQPGSSTGS